MKALSIQQPWAWLIVNGYKDVENRGRRTWHRGETLVHAGKKADRAGYEWVRKAFPEIPLPPLDELPTGGIVGKMNIVDCVIKSPSLWFFGFYGYTLVGCEPLPFFPYKGQRGIFDVEVPV